MMTRSGAEIRALPYPASVAYKLQVEAPYIERRLVTVVNVCDTCEM